MKLSRVSFLFIFLFVLISSASFAQAQTTKTAKGYFCGMSEGDGGFPSITVGNTVMTFSIYGDEPEVKYVGFKSERNKNLWKLPVGSEMIVSYIVKKKYRKPEKIVRKLTLTGKVNKQTKSCGFGDE